jgi:RHS repeat-associated protein
VSNRSDTGGYWIDAAGNLRVVLTFPASDLGYPVQVEAASDDGHGSITTMTDGTTTCDAFFDAFGTHEFPAGGTAPCSTGSSSNSLWYRGGRLDPNAGTYQFGVRTYSPGSATWSQPDAYGASGSDLSLTIDPTTRNPYSYADGDPVNRVDPSGHDSTQQQLQSQLAAEQAQLNALDAQLSAEQAQYQSDLDQQNRLMAEIDATRSQIDSVVSAFAANETSGGWRMATMGSMLSQLGSLDGQINSMQGQYDDLTT